MSVIAEIGRLLESLEGLVGKRVAIEESLSRNRERGHDRHWSTYSHLEFAVHRFVGTISGAQLILEGDRMQYSVAAHAIAEVTFEPSFIITEHFEQRTERKTTIRIV